MMKSVQTRKKNEATFPKRFLCSSVQYILHTMYVYNITLLSVHIHQRVQSDIMLVSPGIFNSGVLTSFRVQSGRFPFFFIFSLFFSLSGKWPFVGRSMTIDEREIPHVHTRIPQSAIMNGVQTPVQIAWPLLLHIITEAFLTLHFYWKFRKPTLIVAICSNTQISWYCCIRW